MKKTGLFLLLVLGFVTVKAQNITVQQYIDTYKEMAIREMKRSGVPAAITLAQGILETESGNSDLVIRSNNHFGIKCKSNWAGASVYHDDDERGECFRKYETAEASFRDHSNFLKNSARYASLFELDVRDYKGWAHGLKKAGYATNPRYPNILINSIEKYNLQQYTEQGLENENLFATGSVSTDSKKQEIAIVPVSNPAPSASTGSMSKSVHNGLKAVYVTKGTSLLAIATQFDISLSKLVEYNDRQTDGLLDKDQWIYLERKQKEGNADVYIANAEQNVYDVAQATGVQLSAIMEFNSFSSYQQMRTGAKVKLRPGVIVEEEPVRVPLRTVHYVQPKESLYVISRKYNVTVDEVKSWNKLATNDLKIGQELIILK